MKILSKKRGHDNMQRANPISNRLHAGYRYAQDRWATWMSRRTGHFSRRTWTALLICFVLSATAYSVYEVISSMRIKKTPVLSITPIKRPNRITETGVPNTLPSKMPDENGYERIKRFRMYMDSLARSPGGKVLYDSITSNRPGLMDSVRLIENYYQQLKQQ